MLRSLAENEAATPAPTMTTAPPPFSARHGQKPVDVLYLLDTWDGPRGGTESQLLQLVRALDLARFAPHVWVLRGVPAPVGAPLVGPPRVLGVRKLLSLGALVRLAKMSRKIRQLNIRLVHIFLNDASIVGPIFSKLAGAKVVVSRRDLGFWYDRRTLAALRISNLFVDRIVANSEQVSRSVRRHEWTRSHQMTVIRNGHDFRRFDAPPIPHFREAHGMGRADPIVGIVANLKPLKRHADLLLAFAKVRTRHPAAHLVLVGTGEEEAPLRALAQSLRLGRAVHFLGFVPDAVPVVKHFDVAVLCSETEGFSNALVEYLACGKPVVCTNVGGNTELVRDGINGLVVQVGDVEALADRIDRILSDGSLARRLASVAARTPLARISAEEMAALYMRLYEELLQE